MKNLINAVNRQVWLGAGQKDVAYAFRDSLEKKLLLVLSFGPDLSSKRMGWGCGRFKVQFLQ